MGNQISTSGRRKSGAPFRKGLVPAKTEAEGENLSRQETLKPTSTKSSTRFSKIKFALPGSSSSSSSASTATVPTSILPQETTGTDGASTPKDEPYHVEVPAPSLMNDAQYLSLSLSLGTVSPSEASTITQGILETVDLPPTPTSPPATQDTWFSSLSRPSSSSTSSDPQFSSRPTSSATSLGSRPHPLFPIRSPLLEKVPAPSLLPAHFACYQGHRRMLVSRNAQHPVPCMVCRVEDEEVRWKCVWCCLRICRGCMARLNKTERRDLRTLVRKTEVMNEERATSDQDGNTNLDLKGKMVVPTSAVSTLADKVSKRQQEDPS
ncbi:MAG: hypothetical protein LQ338_004501 [Usnochroma carphineum]|nr:MAG: hypothetical protein LQ338_004501 [Usnochroma carphineum]